MVQALFILRSLASSGLVRHVTQNRAVTVGGWTLLVVAIYVFNGVTDLAADQANGSLRPVATGELSTRSALAWSAALAVAGVGLCGVAGIGELCIAIAMIVLGWAYSAGPSLKSSPTGFALVIGLGAALTYLAGRVAAGGLTATSLATYGSVAGWVGLCCAAKDFSDVEGDRAAGRRTWPVLLGARRAALLVAVLAIAGATAIALAAHADHLPSMTAVPLALGSITLGVSALASAQASDRRTRRRPYRAFMATQYATNLALLLAA